jgi:penicillin amidase
VMSDASTTDLRAFKVLPWALRVIGPARELTDAREREAVELLTEWANDGGHRRDRDKDGTYEHSRAIQIMDAWWPLWMRGEFEPVLGSDLFNGVKDQVGALDNEPNFVGTHEGSAYDTGFYGYARKDLRTVIGGKTKQRVRGRYSRVYCGNGSRPACRAALLASLADALGVTHADLYGQSGDCKSDAQASCFDKNRWTAASAISIPPFAFQNRPTFQQVIELTRTLGR